MYNLKDIQALELRTIQTINNKTGSNLVQNHQYQEEIGHYLWSEWNHDQDSQYKKDDFILYMMPFITNLIQPYIRFLDENLEYDDLFQLSVIELMNHIPKYKPQRLNKKGELSKVFTYFTLVIQYFIIRTTTANTNRAHKTKLVTETLYGNGTDSAEVFMEFINYLDALRQSKNIRKSHKLIYETLLNMLLTESEHHLVANNLIPTLCKRCKISRDSGDVESALNLLTTVYGQLKFTNIEHCITLNNDKQ